MDIHQKFTKWSVAQGVRLNGVAAHRFPGKGLGIIAEKRLNAGDTILTVPTSALRTVDTIPESISRLVGTITIHALMAIELAMEAPKVRAPWRVILPTQKDFEESIPLMWHPSLQALLPVASLSLLENQKKKLSLDWTIISTTFPTLSYDLYLYNWLLVNTRTFYYNSPKKRMEKPLNRDDCLAFIPFADLFNHADVGCEVTFSPSEYQICTDRQVEEGEEVYISYGNHSNDFLLAEYGFILDENKWDHVSLDEVILPLFSDEQKQKLEEVGFLGNFILNRDLVCYRTQVVLRLLCMPPNRWQRPVATSLEDEDGHQVAVNKILSKALNAHLDTVRGRLDRVKVISYGLPSQRDTLSRRWEQIRLLLTTAIDRIEIQKG